MQCTDNLGCFPRKSKRGATQLFFLFSCVQCFLSCFWPTGCEAYSFTTDGYGIFTVRTHLGARVPYTDTKGGGQTQNQICTRRVDSEGQKICSLTLDQPRGPNPGVFGFEPRLSNHRARDTQADAHTDTTRPRLCLTFSCKTFKTTTKSPHTQALPPLGSPERVKHGITMKC